MKKILITILCVLGLLCYIANTQAATINLNFNTTSADFLVGTVTSGFSSNGVVQPLPLDQLLSMNTNSTLSTNFTFVRSDLSNSNFPVTNGFTSTTINTTSGPLIPVDSVDFVVAQFGNQSALWFIGNLAATDLVQVPTIMGQNSISRITTLANTTGNAVVITTGNTGTTIGNQITTPTGTTTVIPTVTTTGTTGATIGNQITTPTGTITVIPTASTTGNTGATVGNQITTPTGTITVIPTASTTGNTGVNTGIAIVDPPANKNVSKVPEPSTILLLGLGFLSLAVIRKKKFQRC